MKEQISIWEWLQDWWQILGVAGGGALAFWGGQKQQKWKLQQLMQEQEQIKRRLEEIERADVKTAIVLGKMETMLTNISTTLNDIKQELHKKADK